jgi:glycosyltransferase involved in cell wall biosynthesis
MRILFLSNLHPTRAHPGRGTFNARLIDGIRRAGHAVQAIVPVGWRDDQGSDDPDVRPVRWFRPPLVRRDLWDHWMWWSVGAPAMEMAKTLAPDLVWSAWVHPDAGVGLRLARRLGIPAVTMAGGSDVLQMPGRRRREAVARVLRASDAVLTHGEHLRRAALELGAHPETTVAFYRGVDADMFLPGSRAAARERLGLEADTPLILSVGNLVPVKGLDVLVRALAMPALQRRAWRWVHLGEGPEHGRLTAAVTAAGLAGRVRLAGRQSHGDLVHWYRAADVQVLPSRSEGVPNVLMEGLATGLPFVASAVGGVPEIAPDPSWCVPPDDPVGLADAIGRALDRRPAFSPRVPTAQEGVQAVLDVFARARERRG